MVSVPGAGELSKSVDLHYTAVRGALLLLCSITPGIKRCVSGGQACDGHSEG